MFSPRRCGQVMLQPGRASELRTKKLLLISLALGLAGAFFLLSYGSGTSPLPTQLLCLSPTAVRVTAVGCAFGCVPARALHDRYTGPASAGPRHFALQL